MLRAYIFKHPLFSHCSNAGISENHNMVTVVNANGPNKEPSEDAPPVIIIARVMNDRSTILTAYPAVCVNGEWRKESGKWHMNGGSFIHSSDGRFSELLARLGHPGFYGAVSLHDRTE